MRTAIHTSQQIDSASSYQGMIGAAFCAADGVGFAASGADGWITTSPVMLTLGELPPVKMPGLSNIVNTGRSE